MSVVESDLPIWGLPCPMDSPVWDASPGFLPDSAIGFAQAVEAGRADLCPRGRPLPPGQTLCLPLTCCSVSSPTPASPCLPPTFPFVGLRVCLGPLPTHSPWNRVLTLLSNFAHSCPHGPLMLSLHLGAQGPRGPQPALPPPSGPHSSLAVLVCAVMRIPWLPWSA